MLLFLTILTFIIIIIIAIYSLLIISRKVNYLWLTLIKQIKPAARR